VTDVYRWACVGVCGDTFYREDKWDAQKVWKQDWHEIVESQEREREGGTLPNIGKTCTVQVTKHDDRQKIMFCRTGVSGLKGAERKNRKNTQGRMKWATTKEEIMKTVSGKGHP